MSTADTNNIGIKLQAVGENLNTWGIYLNNDLVVLSNLASKFNELAVTGDTTISESNYSLTNDTEVACIKLTGTLTAAFSLTFPSREKRLLMWNATAWAVTLKCSASTGFTLPAGRMALIACDAVDIYNVTPNYGGNASPRSGSLDLPAWSAVETAIATASLPATAGTLLVSGTDPAAGYLRAKVTTQVGALTTTQVSGLQSLSLGTVAGASEQLAIIGSNGYAGGFLPGGVKSAQFTPAVGTEYSLDLTASSWTVHLGGMTTPQLEQRIKLNCCGNFPPYVTGTFMGLSGTYLAAGFNGELCYFGTSWGWN